MARKLKFFTKRQSKSMNKEANESENDLNTNNQEQFTNEDFPQESNEINAADDMTEVDLLKNEVAELNDKLIRNIAEFENYKRRSTKERIEFLRNASKDIIIEMLPVLDDFERGLDTMEKSSDIGALKTGVELTYNKFKNILTQKGLTPIIASGEQLDTDLHEAISKIPVTEDAKKNTIIADVEKGYKLNDTIIRYSKVIVGV